jgi:predicted nicotinamide N-methyase
LYELPFSQQDSLEELLSLARKKFEISFEPISIGPYHLELAQLADMESYIDQLAETCTPENGLELPFWAKIWPTSILLGYYVQKLSPACGKRLLEIGAGIGLCGLIAAKHGFEVTITDNHDDALLFARINILKNGLGSKAEVAKLDFSTDSLPARYSYILGSEVLYREETYKPLVNFLFQHLDMDPESEIILARSYERSESSFFDLAREKFNIQHQHIGYKSTADSTQAEEKQLSTIYRLKPQNYA